MAWVLKLPDGKFFTLHGPVNHSKTAMQFSAKADADAYAFVEKVAGAEAFEVADQTRDVTDDAGDSIFGYGKYKR